MSDFLLELRCEEIPARMQAGARASVDKLFREQMQAAGVTHGEVTVWSSPRRLALIARGLPDATEAVREEVKGPRTGAPPQALEGFLRKTGLTQDQLTERNGTWFAVTEKPGRPTAAVLAEAIPAICRAFPWPKSMRWGAASLSSESLRWVRPLSGIVAILGEELVECEVGPVRSAYATLGHRFHHPGEITIGGADDYADKLRACHVIVDHAEREALIREHARAAAEAEGLTLVEDEGLVVENAGVTEWPVPLLGRFDPAFLEVPPEVIQLTARTNQKYFICRDAEGKLANAFVCTANIVASDGGAGVVAGNRKVLAARLSDARFFWEQDRRKTLKEHAEGLARITFHEKLGTVADKVERVAKLARWLVERGIVKDTPLPQAGGAGGGHPGRTLEEPTPDPSRKREGDLADLAEQAARLCKADLVTEMVGEFPELQGVMGGYYARAEGLPDEVADAIRDHYKPVGQADEVPTAPVTVAVSLADKLDSLTIFFLLDMAPTGSKDPFALRRTSLATIATILVNGIRTSLDILIREAMLVFWKHFTSNYKRATDWSEAKTSLEGASSATSIEEEFLFEEGRIGFPQASDFKLASVKSLNTPTLDEKKVLVIDGPALRRKELLDFFADRLKVQQREAGVRYDLIDAVFGLGGEDDLVRLLARVRALQSFIGTEDGANLLTGYKRAANILKKEGYQAPASSDTEWQNIDFRPHGSDEDEHGSDLRAPGPVPRTGEEDPYALVDDPDLGPILAAKLRERNRPSYAPEPEEKALIDALDAAAPRAAAAVEAEDFSGAMAALASLRAPIDAFFDKVTVNDPDPARRDARLALLDRFRAAVHNVADFSRIEG